MVGLGARAVVPRCRRHHELETLSDRRVGNPIRLDGLTEGRTAKRADFAEKPAGGRTVGQYNYGGGTHDHVCSCALFKHMICSVDTASVPSFLA